MVSLKTIAEACGVSTMTVSRALDESKSNQISGETKRQILEVARKYNYRGNKAASSLKRQKTYTIMLFSSFRTFSSPVAAPDFDTHFGCLVGDFIRGLVGTAHEYNYDIKLEPLLNKNCDVDILPYLRKDFTDGVIFQGITVSPELTSRLQSQNIPFVREAVTSSVEYDCTEVFVDKRPGFHQAFEYICRKDYQRIAYIGNARSNNSLENQLMFRSFFEKRNLYNPKLVYNVDDFFELQDLLVGFSGDLPFSALFCMNDGCADMAVRILRKCGIRVPEDVAVVGFDNNIAFTGPGKSNLSTIDGCWHEKGEECFNMLYELIKSGAGHRDCKKSIPSRFIIRETA